MISLSNFKILHQYFPKDQFVLANGITSAGMAFGFLLGAQFSATILAPLVGSWRAVFIIYSVCGILLTLPWFLLIRSEKVETEPGNQPLLGALGEVIRNSSVWLMGFGILGVNGAITGVLGYLPYYLQDIGWDITSSSASLTLFHTTSLIFTMPIVLYSPKILKRRYATIVAGTAIAIGLTLLYFATGWIVWPAVMLAGFSRDGFMALFFTQVSETMGVKPHMIATAIGIAMMMNSIGSIFSPPVGNSMVTYSPSAPFLFWGGLAFIGVFCLTIVAWKERHA